MFSDRGVKLRWLGLRLKVLNTQRELPYHLVIFRSNKTEQNQNKSRQTEHAVTLRIRERYRNYHPWKIHRFNQTKVY